MGNILSTLTIVLAEIAAVLLILVGVLLYRIRRLRLLHQAELDTLMSLAGNAKALRIDPPAAAAAAAAPAPPTLEPGPSQPPSPDSACAPGAYETDDAGLAGHIDEALSEIRQAMEHLDTRLDQFRHEHNLLAAQFRKLVEEGNNEVHYSRRDLDRIYQVVNELRKQFSQLSGGMKAPGQAPVSVSAGPGPAPGPGPGPAPASTAPLPDNDFGPLPAMPLEGIAVEEINISDLDVEDPHGLKDQHARPSHFDEDRIFFQSSLEDGLKQGWYFNGYGDRPQGPFADRASANRVMKEMHEQLTQPARPADQRAAGKS